RPGDCAAGKGAARTARQVGVHGGHRLRRILVPARLPRRRRLVPEGERGAGRAVVAPLAGGHDVGTRRRSSVVEGDVGGNPAVGRDCMAAAGRRAAAGAAARARRDRRAAARGRRLHAPRRPAGGLGGARARPHPPRRTHRSGWRAVRAPKRPRSPRERVAAQSAADRARATAAALVMIDTLPAALGIALAAAVGAIVGSFLNVCIYRLPLRKSVVWPSSACTKCGRELSWYENIPVLSWLALRAQCRTCHTPISVRYPLVEALTATMFALAWWQYGPGALLASRLVLGCALIVLFAIDLEHQLLPNVITLPLIVVGFLFSFFTEPGWAASLIGILAGGGVLFAIAEIYYRVRHQEGLGMGDVKMLAMVGAFLGWKLTVLTLMLASFSGTLIGLVLIVSKRGGLQYALPFGTFLALGAAAAATVGPSLLEWYLGLL